MKFKLIIDKDCEEEIIARVHSASELTSKIENIVLEYQSGDEICVQGDYEMVMLKFADIECVTVIDRKIFVIDKKGQKYRAGGTLGDMEKNLPSYFIRINKSTVANERRISCFKTSFSGAVDAVFKCGYKDYVSRRCLAEIRRRYKG